MALFAHRVEAGVAGLPVLQVSLRSGITAEGLDQFGRPKRLIADPTKYKRISRGDIADNTMRMWQGAVGVSPSDGLVSPAYVVLSPRTGACPDFYDFIFHAEDYKQQVNRQSTGIVSDRNRLYWDSFKQMANVALPSSEQEAIVAFIHSETNGLHTASSRLEREIELLREYRTRLVADVVTGKLDVRQAAARLPDEAPLESIGSDTDLGDEGETDDEGAAAMTDVFRGRMNTLGLARPLANDRWGPWRRPGDDTGATERRAPGTPGTQKFPSREHLHCLGKGNRRYLMRVISRKVIKEFAERMPAAKAELDAWCAEAKAASWSTPAEVKAKYGSASILKDSRVVFNICGNKFRLVVWINYPFSTIYIRFAGTDDEYDNIDAQSV